MVVVHYLFLTLTTIALLVYVGAPWALLLVPRGGRLHLSVAAPLIGLGVLSSFSWYWLEFTQYGLARGLPYLLAFNGLVLVFIAIVKRREARRLDASSLVTAAWLATLILGVFGIFVVVYWQVIGLGTVTAASLGNNDIASWAIHAEFLRHRGFTDHGLTVGSDLGGFARVGTPGAFTTLSAAALFAAKSAWQMTLPVAVAAMALTAIAIRNLVATTLGHSWVRDTAIAVACVAPSLYIYSVNQYFLSQILATPLALGILLLLLDVETDRNLRDAVRRIAMCALILMPILLTYPHMAFLGVPVAAGVAVLAGGASGLLRRGLRVLVVVGSAMLLCVATMPVAVSGAFDRIQKLADVTAGWPLPLLGPSALLGLSGLPNYIPNKTEVLFETAVFGSLCAVALVVLWKRSRRATRICAAIIGTVLVSYSIVYVSRGESYVQWKWIAFWQPLLIAGAAMVVVGSLEFLIMRLPRARRVARSMLAVAVGLVICGLVLVSVEQLDRYIVVGPNNSLRVVQMPHNVWVEVEPMLSGLEGAPALRDVSQINVALPDYWETMWATYFLAPRIIRPQSASYQPVVPPSRGAWTLEPNGNAAAHPPGTQFRKVNDAFDLVRPSTDGVARGTQWTLGDCDGSYVFDGEKWVAQFRTSGSGGFSLHVAYGDQPVGSRSPVLVRGTGKSERSVSAADIFALDRTTADTARFVYIHGQDEVRGPEFAARAGERADLDLVFDPFTREIRATLNDVTVFETTHNFFWPYLQPSVWPEALKTAVGTNTVSSNTTPLFSGSITQRVPQLPTDQRELLDACLVSHGRPVS